MEARKSICLTLVIILVLLLQIISPVLVHADGETPPPTKPPVMISTTHAPPASRHLAWTEVSSETPASTSSPVADPLKISTTEETATPIPADITEESVQPIRSHEPSKRPAAPLEGTPSSLNLAVTVESSHVLSLKEPTLPEVFQRLHTNTTVVVLHPNGRPLPLVSLEAATVIGNGDPVWCPGTQAPTPGANGCSASYTTLGELVTAIGQTVNQNGTIWITSGNASDANPITIDGWATYSTWANYTLTLQGGWSGISADTNIGPNSVFSVPISISYWNNNITINNLTFQGITTETALYIYTGSNLKINQSNFINNQVGMFAGFSAWEGEVRSLDIANSTFTNNNLGVLEFFGCISPSAPNFSNVTFMNNSTDYAAVAIGCPVTPPGPPPMPITPTPLPTYGQGDFDLQCLGKASFAVNLPNGDLVNIFCPVSGTARIHRLDNTTLPANLPIGYTYASAFSLEILDLQDNKPISVITEGGYISASFVAQPLQPGNTYSILYWDPEGSSWVPLKDFLLDQYGKTQSLDLFPGVAGDTRKIISGVNLVARGGSPRVEVSVNFPGVFVLAQH